MFPVVILLAVTACKKKEELTINEPRPLTEADKVSPVQNEESRSASYAYTKPSDWEDVQPTGFRKINFSAGTDTEIYLSESRGDALSNANRWLGQFGNTPEGDLNAFKPITLLGQKGYLVETVGDFKGFGASTAKPNYKLAGALVEIKGVLVTVKMTGPKAEVDQRISGFIEFCSSLRAL